MLIAKRTYTRSRTHDYLLKGLIYCKECGYVFNVVCRKLAGGKDVLYFLCQTHQRFPANSKCSLHYFRVDAIQEKVLQRVREVCEEYLDLSEMQRFGKQYLDERKEPDNKNALAETENKIAELTKKLDSVYEDKLSGVLSPEDFERIYERIKTERETLGKKLQALQNLQNKTKTGTNISVKAKKLAVRFLNEIDVNKELIFSLIERIEVSKEGEITLNWAFAGIDDK
jgi:hypothetical protein